MNYGVDTLKDLLELTSYIATVLGIVALIYGLFAYRLNKKQLNFSVLDRCITIFQDKFAGLSGRSDPALVKAYVDLVNEELFYFEQGYIPKDVAYEWIDGMIEYIPIYNRSNGVLNPSNSLSAIHENGILNSFQRVRRAFKVKRDYNFELIYSGYIDEASFGNRKRERRRLIKEIYGNVV